MGELGAAMQSYRAYKIQRDQRREKHILNGPRPQNQTFYAVHSDSHSCTSSSSTAAETTPPVHVTIRLLSSRARTKRQPKPHGRRTSSATIGRGALIVICGMAMSGIANGR